MDSERYKPDIKLEQVKPTIKMDYQLKDIYGRIFSTVESSELVLVDAAPEARYFDGSIETPYGNFMLECEVVEAKKALQAIQEFVKSTAAG